MILVVCAVAAELRGFARAGVEVVAVGVGPVEAALGTMRALCARRYELVVNAGIAGGFEGRADVGDALAVTSERYVELGREDGAALALPGGLQLAVACDADAATVARFRSADRATVAFGPAITSATVTTSAARATSLAAAFDAVAESMEGFAVLRAAAAAGVPGMELRGISNIVGDRATSRWDFRAGATAAVRALEALLDVVKGTP